VDAGQVAGLLILLGVVGVLAAIVGSGIEAGPVKFPSIPGSRQKPLALASVVVIAGGVSWSVIQHSENGGGKTTTTAADTGPAATGKLRISLIPTKSNIIVGEKLSVRAEVYDSNGHQLGPGQCELTWNDRLSHWTKNTGCTGTSEPHVSQPGVHHIAVRAQGTGGLLARGGPTPVAVTVRR
jgi:hypothetical protein